MVLLLTSNIPKNFIFGSQSVSLTYPLKMPLPHYFHTVGLEKQQNNGAGKELEEILVTDGYSL